MIRRLTPEDAALWREFRLAALRIAPEAFSARYEDWVDRPASDFAARIAEAAVFVFEKGDCVLGTAVLSPGTDAARSNRGWVEAVFVRPEARGQGVAAALLRALLDAAKSEAMTELCLDVAASNVAARRAYEQAGFITLADRPEGSNSACDITMRLATG